MKIAASPTIFSSFKKWYVLAIGITLLCAFASTMRPQSTAAVSASDWRAGRIIDDAIYYNSSSMSRDDIQNFLNSKVRSCDTWGTQPASEKGRPDITRAEYARLSGWPGPPYICLKDYYQVPRSDKIINNYNSTASRPAGSISAASIIKNASVKYGVNPKTIIVLLQKESPGPLPIDTWPLQAQYKNAMGYACPDTAPCDPQYAGFYNQIMNAARQIKLYRDNADSYKHRPFRTNSVLYNPNSRCGSSNVYIETYATAGLYNYTPYQPNKAALANMYGTGDSCSAYGNRNFWRIFNDWFGSTYGSPFVSYGNTVYMQGVSRTYYRVSSPSILRSYGHGTLFGKIPAVNKAWLDARTYKGVLPQIARFEGDEIYAVSDGGLSQFTSRDLYEKTYGYSMGQEAQLPKIWRGSYRSLNDMQQMIRSSSSGAVYSMEAQKKRHVSSPSVYKTLGSPIYSSRPLVNLGSTFISSVPNGSPILAPNTFAKATDKRQVFYWDGSIASMFNAADVVEYLTPKASYSTSSALLLQLPKNSSSITRYAKTSSGEYYALYENRKFGLSASSLTKLGISKESVPILPKTVTDLFTTTNVNRIPLLRFGSNDRVYRQPDTESGDIYGVFDRFDMSKFGDIRSVVALPNELSKLFQDKGLRFSKNRLVQVAGNPKVYIADEAKSVLFHIPTRDFATQYNIGLYNIALVKSLGQAPSYTTSQLTRFVKDVNNAYWLIDSKGKLSASYSMLLGNYGHNTNTVYASPSQDILLPIKTKDALTIYLRDPSNGRVYKIENGKKRWYSSRIKFEQQASWADVRTVSNGFLATIPTGTSI